MRVRARVRQYASGRKTLRIALVLNATMFVVGMAAGLWAQSSGLMADALDMLTDATAYAIGLMAVGEVFDSSNILPGGRAQRSCS